MKFVLNTFSLAALALMIAAAPALACNGRGDCDRDDTPGHVGESHGHPGGAPGRMGGAPAPIAGAGLPVLAIGYGVYWLIKRRRKVD